MQQLVNNTGDSYLFWYYKNFHWDTYLIDLLPASKNNLLNKHDFSLIIFKAVS